MGLPAFFVLSQDPASSSDREQIALSPAVRERCAALWDAARAEWSVRPAEDTDAEDRAIAATCAVLLEVSRASSSTPRAARRALVHQGLRRVIREQRTAAVDARVFALRQLEQALEHYGVAVESLETAAAVDELASEFSQHDANAARGMAPELRPLFRAHGALLMAFDAMTSGTDAELRYWARHAVESWRGVVGSLASLTALTRAGRVHLRARRAWNSWTDDDRATEASAWKSLL
jgi:hypothetical protein